jgi:2-hydroxychromene-2-carboxylate isomerase
MKKCVLYFDFLSPYSYFFWQFSKNLRKKYSFEYKPVVMAKLFEHFETKGPAEVLPKRIFLLKQCFRLSDKYKIPFQTPHHHPFNPLYALRLATQSVGHDQQEKIIDALWSMVWEQKISVDDPDAIAHYLHSQGLDGSQLIELISAKEVKTELKMNTDEAIQKGVFGVPSVIVDEVELFWGQDSLNDLTNFLEGKDLFNAKKLEEFL